MTRSRVKTRSNRSSLKVAQRRDYRNGRPIPHQTTFRGNPEEAQRFADETKKKSERYKEEIRTLPERRRRYNQNRKPGQPHWPAGYVGTVGLT